MPSNIRSVIKSKKKETSGLVLALTANLQKNVVLAIMKNLALFSPVLSGELAGGWRVLFRATARKTVTDPLLNPTYLMSDANRRKIDKITGKGTITIQNDVEYTRIQNETQNAGYINRAMTAARSELAARGVDQSIVDQVKFNF